MPYDTVIVRGYLHRSTTCVAQTHDFAGGVVAPRLCCYHDSRRKGAILFRHARGCRRRPCATPRAAEWCSVYLFRLVGLGEGEHGAAATRCCARVAARQRLSAAGSCWNGIEGVETGSRLVGRAAPSTKNENTRPQYNLELNIQLRGCSHELSTEASSVEQTSPLAYRCAFYINYHTAA